MEIIPAIDILNNIVVQAKGGKRKNYKPLKSQMFNSNSLEDVIRIFLKEYNFKKFYIADLNSITKKNHNYAIIKKTIKKFPKIDFWIDYGITTYEDFERFKLDKCTLVLGSETLKSSDELRKIISRKNKYKSILSLDFKNSSFLGSIEILKKNELWTKKIILIFLNKVGSNSGPNFNLIKKIKKNFKNNFYLGGGIRNNKDMKKLKKIGFAGGILFNALHRRQIIYKNL
tara:strand:- start:581 stop:1267 length:687 start_codon:yes stop_codon:yes gene_type:complete